MGVYTYTHIIHIWFSFQFAIYCKFINNSNSKNSKNKTFSKYFSPYIWKCGFVKMSIYNILMVKTPKKTHIWHENDQFFKMFLKHASNDVKLHVKWHTKNFINLEYVYFFLVHRDKFFFYKYTSTHQNIKRTKLTFFCSLHHKLPILQFDDGICAKIIISWVLIFRTWMLCI
jgi:hypothetical protein